MRAWITDNRMYRVLLFVLLGLLVNLIPFMVGFHKEDFYRGVSNTIACVTLPAYLVWRRPDIGNVNNIYRNNLTIRYTILHLCAFIIMVLLIGFAFYCLTRYWLLAS